MKHLTTEQIIGFVSLSELNSDSVKLCSAVNTHIRECEKCRKVVRAAMNIHDEFMRNGADREFSKYVTDILARQKPSKEKNLGFKTSDIELD